MFLDTYILEFCNIYKKKKTKDSNNRKEFEEIKWINAAVDETHLEFNGKWKLEI